MADDGDMPGEGQDICSFFASFINQRQQVERLLHWLRDSQTACTDTNCFDDINGFPGSEHGGALLTSDGADGYDGELESEPFSIIMMIVLGFLTLYALSLNRNRAAENTESVNKFTNSSSEPPNRRDGNGGNDGGSGGDDYSQQRPAT